MRHLDGGYLPTYSHKMKKISGKTPSMSKNPLGSSPPFHRKPKLTFRSDPGIESRSDLTNEALLR